MQSVLRSIASLVLILPASVATSQISISLQVGKPDRTILGLPFTADQTVHTLSHLANGLVVTHDVHGHIARNAAGVERYEGTFTSDDPAHPNPTTLAYIVDHTNRTTIVLNETLKTAVRQPLPPVALVSVNLLPLQANGPPAKSENVTTTDLGKKNIGMMEITGRMVSGDIPAGKLGNDQPLPISTEVWIAEQLKLVVTEVEKNPQSGERDFELTNIRSEEPDPSLFQIPDGYKITDRPAVPSTPAEIQAAREARAAGENPTAPVQRTRQIEDALKNPDPIIKNNIAYALAVNNDHLADAQLLTEQALQIEEKQTADNVSGADPAKAFDQMVMLSRFWDTAGFVYYHSHKFEKAEAYISAAWELNPNSVFATHLGLVYQSDHKFPQAIAMYRMGLSANPAPAALDAIQSELAKLSPSTSDRLPIDIAMPLPELALTLTPGDDPPLMDIVLSHGHTPSVTWLKGDKALRKPVTEAVQTALAPTLPDDGPEFVIRRAQLACDGTACSLHFTNTRQFTAAEQARRNGQH